MKRSRKVSAGSPYVKKGEEIKDGDIITISNEGQEIPGQFGDQFVIKITLLNGDERAMTLNQTSENNLIEAYGEDSIKWVGKKAKVFLDKKILNGKKVIIAYLSSPDWERDEFGEFTNGGDQGTGKDDLDTIQIEDVDDGWVPPEE